MTITPATNIFAITSSNSANWLANTVVAIQSQSDSGLIGSLANAAKNKPGSIGAFLNSTRASATDMVTISQGAVTNATQLALARGDAVTKARADAATQKALDDLAAVSNSVQPKNVLDSIIYFDDGSTIDTNQNIYTRPDGSQYDAVTGAPYVDPANIVQMANGAYLNTLNNIMTMPDGTQIDVVTGLNVNQLNPVDESA
jgi:hypothetical protein